MHQQWWSSDKPQPTYAGPTYFIRNVTYNCPYSAIKFAGAEGSLFYNNTFTCKMSTGAGSNFQSMNNLVLNQNAGEKILSMTTYTNYSKLDYNGYRPNDTVPGMASPGFGPWGHPPYNQLANYTSSQLITDTFPTLAAFQQSTGQDTHSILIDWNVFKNGPLRCPGMARLLHHVAGL